MPAEKDKTKGQHEHLSPSQVPFEQISERALDVLRQAVAAGYKDAAPSAAMPAWCPWPHAQSSRYWWATSRFRPPRSPTSLLKDGK